MVYVAAERMGGGHGLFEWVCRDCSGVNETHDLLLLFVTWQLEDESRKGVGTAGGNGGARHAETAGFVPAIICQVYKPKSLFIYNSYAQFICIL